MVKNRWEWSKSRTGETRWETIGIDSEMMVMYSSGETEKCTDAIFMS